MTKNKQWFMFHISCLSMSANKKNKTQKRNSNEHILILQDFNKNNIGQNEQM